MQVVRMSRRPRSSPLCGEDGLPPVADAVRTLRTSGEDSGRTVGMRTLTATRGCAASNSFTTGTVYFYIRIHTKLSSAT